MAWTEDDKNRVKWFGYLLLAVLIVILVGVMKKDKKKKVAA